MRALSSPYSALLLARVQVLTVPGGPGGCSLQNGRSKGSKVSRRASSPLGEKEGGEGRCSHSPHPEAVGHPSARRLWRVDPMVKRTRSQGERLQAVTPEKPMLLGGKRARGARGPSFGYAWRFRSRRPPAAALLVPAPRPRACCAPRPAPLRPASVPTPVQPHRPLARLPPRPGAARRGRTERQAVGTEALALRSLGSPTRPQPQARGAGGPGGGAALGAGSRRAGGGGGGGGRPSGSRGCAPTSPAAGTRPAPRSATWPRSPRCCPVCCSCPVRSAPPRAAGPQVRAGRVRGGAGVRDARGPGWPEGAQGTRQR